MGEAGRAPLEATGGSAPLLPLNFFGHGPAPQALATVPASARVREGEMDQFVSTFTNRIDTKGRVSVPASFRTVLAKDGLDGIYCYPSLDAPAKSSVRPPAQSIKTTRR